MGSNPTPSATLRPAGLRVGGWLERDNGRLVRGPVHFGGEADGCPTPRNALQSRAAGLKEFFAVAAPAERMKTMRDRRRLQGLRELRLVLPDARSPSVRRRVAKEVARLQRSGEDDALNWIEAVSEFDA